MTILDKAAEIVSGERQKQYGHVKDNFELIARLWGGYLEKSDLNASDVAHMMILLKVARASAHGNYHEDSCVDIAGYARCLEILHESRQREAACIDDMGME